MLESGVTTWVIPKKETVQQHVSVHADAIEAQKHLTLVALLRCQLEVLAIPAYAAHGMSCLLLPQTRVGIVELL